MPDNSREILNDAIARNCAVVLSLPSAGMLRHHKSRFLGSEATGMWVEAPAGEMPLINELIGTQKAAGISFKSVQTKVVFAAAVLEFRSEFRMNSETVVPAALIAFPEQIKAIQRRANYRVKVFADGELTARVWRIAPRVYIGDRPMASQEVTTVLRDMSVGGMGVTFFGEEGQPPKISTEDRLRIEIRFRETVILLEGRMRAPAGPQPADGIFSGIQFKEMAGDIEGRQKTTQLTRIVGEMQREEVRRARMGVA